MNDRIHPLSLAVLSALSLLMTFYVWGRPMAHWDVIAYVAVALEQSGLSGAALHEKTYEAIRAAYDPETFAALIGTPGGGHGGYRHAVFSDPVSLEQQLPFYRIRMAYIMLLNGLAPLTGSLVSAAQAVSAFCAGAITFIAGLLLLRRPGHIPSWAVFIMLPLIVAGAGVVLAGRMETPDLLASLVALMVLALWQTQRMAALVLLALLPLIRTDGIVLATLLLGVMLYARERRWWYYIPLLCAGMTYVLVTFLYGEYGHLQLFTFTLLNDGPNPYPAEMDIVTDIAVYVKFYVFAVIKFAPTLLFLAVILLIIAAEVRATGGMSPFTAMALVAVCFVGLHFLLFPLGSPRHYVFAIVFAAVYAVRTLWGWEMPRVAGQKA